MTKIASAGNSDTAAFAVIVNKGYATEIKEHPNGTLEWCIGSSNGNEFIGDSWIEVLGLISIYEERGEHWYPTDDEVDARTRIEEPNIQN